MKLNIRNRQRKRRINQLRRDGDIPAVIYGKGEPGVAVTLKASDFEAVVRRVKEGHLSTTVFHLVDEEGKEYKAIVKDIQYHPTTYKVLHLDFEQLHDDVPITVKVPIEYTHADECIGIKHGGVLRKVIRKFRVRCLPKDMPTHFELSVKDLELLGTKRLADIKLPENVSPRAKVQEVAVVIAKR